MTPEEIKALANHVWTELSICPDITQALKVIEEALEKASSAAWTDGYNSRVFEEGMGYGPHEK